MSQSNKPSLILSAAALCLLAGCSSVNFDVFSLDPVELGDSNTALASLPQPTSEPYVLRGEIQQIADYIALVPCDTDNPVALYLDENTKQTFTGEPSERIYAELSGYMTEANSGQQSRYAFAVTGVNVRSNNLKQCRIDTMKLTAAGHEPYWYARVSDDYLVLRHSESFDRREKIDLSAIADRQQSYQTQDYSLSVNKASCKDSVSNAKFGWTATLVLGDEEFSGCAAMPNNDIDSEWVGRYQGEIEENKDTLTTEMTLYPDHRVVTRYIRKYQPATEETGIWQAMKDGKVEVIVMKSRAAPFDSKRVFRREGDLLVADTEELNGQPLPLAGGGLQLRLVNQSLINL